ncbi:SixA phosphatase family protein [Roseobacter weihaiensis]|uniref:SixA phosphatase family protein n=1 Tax=Roseobacter weihaiensis TaxID=2763262 RepID=UPI001D0AFEF3|nr:histidine phosphatase family protein [Roseobacter sp. H9]
MRRLILMRHAKSDWSHTGLTDHDRPLNKRGRGAAEVLGNWLRHNDHAPEEVLCSSAERTRQTLRGLALTPAPRTSFTRTLYLAEARVILEVLNRATTPCVLILGHNPGICELANRLVDKPPAHDRFHDYPTGATLVCDFDTSTWMDVDWAQGRVVDFVVPRELQS